MIEGILKMVKRLWPRDDVQRTNPENKFRAFTIAWLLLPLIFFSLSNSKLPGYILPIFPAAALIVGERLSRISLGQENSKWVIRITAGLFLLCAAGVLVEVQRFGGLSLSCAVLLAALLAAAGAFALAWTKRGTVFAMFTGGATLVTMFIILNCGGVNLAKGESTKQLLELAYARGYSQVTVYGIQRNDRTPEFYAAGHIAYDADGEATKYEGVGQVVAESQLRQATVLAFVPLRDVGQFTQLSSVRVDVVGNNGRVALLAVGP